VWRGENKNETSFPRMRKRKDGRRGSGALPCPKFWPRTAPPYYAPPIILGGSAPDLLSSLIRAIRS